MSYSYTSVLYLVQNNTSHLYAVYSLGAGEEGWLMFLLPKFPFHRIESFKTMIADIEGSMVV